VPPRTARTAPLHCRHPRAALLPRCTLHGAEITAESLHSSLRNGSAPAKRLAAARAHANAAGRSSAASATCRYRNRWRRARNRGTECAHCTRRREPGRPRATERDADWKLKPTLEGGVRHPELQHSAIAPREGPGGGVWRGRGASQSRTRAAGRAETGPAASPSLTGRRHSARLGQAK
jgi:hypothetical protein